MEGIAEQGLLALAFVNSAAFVAHAPGGARPVYGTNPLALGCPRGAGRPPLVFDMATAAMARGEIQLLARAGEPLPLGAGVDAAGMPCTDAAEVLGGGAQLPIGGGHKGSNLALLVELLAAAATSSPGAVAASKDLASDLAGKPNAPPGGCPSVNGELVLALDPARFGWGTEGDLFGARVEAILEAVVGSGAAGELRLPGERRLAHRAAAKGAVEVDVGLLHAVETLSI